MKLVETLPSSWFSDKFRETTKNLVRADTIYILQTSSKLLLFMLRKKWHNYHDNYKPLGDIMTTTSPLTSFSCLAAQQLTKTQSTFNLSQDNDGK